MEVSMTRLLPPFRLLVLLASAAFIIGGCSKDDIPSTPSPPFLFTSMIIGKTTSPTPGTTLQVGQTVTARFEVDYTLAPADDAGRAKLAILTGVVSRNATGVETVIVAAPAAPPVLAASSGAIPQTLTFTVPTGSKRIFIVAFIDTLPSVNTVLRLDSQDWPVQ
jgi:hypothetical protein